MKGVVKDEFGQDAIRVEVVVLRRWVDAVRELIPYETSRITAKINRLALQIESYLPTEGVTE